MCVDKTSIPTRLPSDAAGKADFSSLFEFLPLGAYRSFPDGRQLRANPALAKLNGYASEAEMLDSVRDIGTEWYVEPGRRQLFREALERDGKISEFVSEVYRHKTRERIWINENAHMVRSADGQILYYEGTVEDVTAQMAALAELRLGNRVLSATQELAGVGGVYNDLVHHRVTLTDGVYRMLDLDPHEHRPSPATLLNYFTPESSSLIATAIQHSNETGESYDLELEMVTAKGRHIWVHTKNVVTMEHGRAVQRTALLQDITARKQANSIIWQQANFDALTGLPNRRMLRDRLEQDILRSRRDGMPVAVIFLDLDHFKEVNDSLGHAYGDLLLIEAGRRIQACVRASDTVARMGGDEFTVVLAALLDPTRVELIAQHILDALAQPFELGGERVYISGSAGIALFPTDAFEIEDLLRDADQALYDAKAAGRSRFSYFTPALQRAAQNRLAVAKDLRKALALGQMHMVYQPIVEMATGRIFKAEALLRWDHPERGAVEPGVFIPIAESSGLINEIGDWAFQQACLQVSLWRKTIHPQFQISVNKSPAQFRNGAASQQRLFGQLRDLGLGGDSLTVEITEGLLMDRNEDVNARLQELRSAGIQVALDDFGTGYSSLAYLQSFDIDYLKIDQRFVQGLTGPSRNYALCKAIILMAHELGMRVIAEGVETQEQHALLKAAECDFAQGYWLGRPVKPGDFAQTPRTKPNTPDSPSPPC